MNKYVESISGSLAVPFYQTVMPKEGFDIPCIEVVEENSNPQAKLNKTITVQQTLTFRCYDFTPSGSGAIADVLFRTINGDVSSSYIYQSDTPGFVDAEPEYLYFTEIIFSGRVTK